MDEWRNGFYLRPLDLFALFVLQLGLALLAIFGVSLFARAILMAVVIAAMIIVVVIVLVVEVVVVAAAVSAHTGPTIIINITITTTQAPVNLSIPVYPATANGRRGRKCDTRRSVGREVRRERWTLSEGGREGRRGRRGEGREGRGAGRGVGAQALVDVS